MAEEKFIRVPSGAIYRWSTKLARRKDGVVVDGHAAADYFRSRGVKNDITERYPKRDFRPAIPTEPPKKQRRVGAKGKTVVSDEAEPDALEGLLNDGKNVPTGN